MIKCESTSICVVAVTTGREGGGNPSARNLSLVTHHRSRSWLW